MKRKARGARSATEHGGGKPRGKAEAPRGTGAGGPRLYTLKVSILCGPMSDDVVSTNPQPSRTIEIRGDQTLEELHYALYAAFGRDEEHMYEFAFGKRPRDPRSIRYTLPMALDDGDPAMGDLTETTLDSLALKPHQVFFYLFDFGDEWWHDIRVLATDGLPSRGKYPRVTARVGKSPPQYPEID